MRLRGESEVSDTECKERRHAKQTQGKSILCLVHLENIFVLLMTNTGKRLLRQESAVSFDSKLLLESSCVCAETSVSCRSARSKLFVNFCILDILGLSHFKIFQPVFSASPPLKVVGKRLL